MLELCGLATASSASATTAGTAATSTASATTTVTTSTAASARAATTAIATAISTAGASAGAYPFHAIEVGFVVIGFVEVTTAFDGQSAITGWSDATDCLAGFAA